MAALPAACALLLLVVNAQAFSQQPSLRGSVVSAETGLALGYSIVELRPGLGPQFTTASGAFAFSALTPGTYLLSVRQIAYTPVDTQIAIPEEGETIVHVALRHLAIELPPVTIAASQCMKRSEEHTSELQSLRHLVCRLLLEK